MKILIVEDDRDAGHLLKLILSPYGDIDMAEDGVEALEACGKAWEKDKPYDLICLDIMMPRMNGLETLKQLREEEESRGIGGIINTKVVMITAREDQETITEALVLGCEGYVKKTDGRIKILEKLVELGLIDEITTSEAAHLPK